MANTVRIKRRAAGGAAGAPASLQNAELAFNEQDNTLYYGFGTGGAGGSATSIIPIAGTGAFADLTSIQTITGAKTFSSTITGSISGNAGTATALQTGRTIAITGDITYTSPSFNGSGNVTAAATLATVATAGTYRSVTINAKGLVTSGTNPTTLAGYGITDAQPLDGDLTAIAALAGTSGFLKKTATDTWTLDTATYLTGNQSIAVSGDASGSGTTAITLTLASVGTAGTYTKVTTDAKGRVTAGTTLAATDIPSLTAAKITDFDTQVRLSRLDQLAAPTASVSLNSQRITGLLDPVNAQDAASKNYVDSVAQGLDAKQSVKAATTANITLSATQTIDGISVVVGERVLVKNQTQPAENGIYIVAAGAWTRSTDMGTWLQVPNSFVFIEQGTTQADTSWVATSDQGGTLGTTAITWAQFGAASSYTAGNGLTLTGNSFSVVGTANRIAVTGSGVDIASTYVGQNTITTLGTVTTGTWNATAIAADKGGTGQTSYTVGDILFAGTTTTLSKLAGVATGNVLLSGGVGTAPAYGKVGLTTHVSGTLPIANGGTNTTATATNGGVTYGTGTAYAFTAAGTSGQVLRANGAAAPTWVELDLTYLPSSSFKKSVRVATFAAITLSGTQAIDGITLVAGDRVLVRNQSSAPTNGIYVVAAGAWARAADADTSAKLAGATVAVDEGTVSGGRLFRTELKSTDVLGTASVTFSLVIDGTSTQALTNKTLSTGSLWNGSTITVPYGGTGATSLTGYVKGNGTAAFTAATTIPNTDITGLGTMSTQDADFVAITGGAITNLTTFDGITIDCGTF